jgi:probable rRNA maturation factor
MVINTQKRTSVDLAAARAYVRKLRGTLGLGRREFNVCFVDDRKIEKLNATYLARSRPTDVLAFPSAAPTRRPIRGRAAFGRVFPDGAGRNGREGPAGLRDFLGDVVISAEMARRNATAEGHSTQNEIRWLILHGLLHLLGYDHETDQGEMTALELSLRDRLEGRSLKTTHRRTSRGRGGTNG